MGVMEIFAVLKELRTGFATILQILPATANGHQLILQGVSSWNAALSSQQVSDL